MIKKIVKMLVGEPEKHELYTTTFLDYFLQYWGHENRFKNNRSPLK